MFESIKRAMMVKAISVDLFLINLIRASIKEARPMAKKRDEQINRLSPKEPPAHQLVAAEFTQSIPRKGMARRRVNFLSRG